MKNKNDIPKENGTFNPEKDFDKLIKLYSKAFALILSGKPKDKEKLKEINEETNRLNKLQREFMKEQKLSTKLRPIKVSPTRKRLK